MSKKCCLRFRFKAKANGFLSAKNSPKVEADIIIVSVNQPISDRCYIEGDSYVPSCLSFVLRSPWRWINAQYWNDCIPCVSDREAACGGSVLRPVWWTTSAAAAGGAGRTSAGMNTSARLSWVRGRFERRSCPPSCQKHIEVNDLPVMVRSTDVHFKGKQKTAEGILMLYRLKYRWNNWNLSAD